MFKFKEKSGANLLLYSLSHFECDGLTQQRLPPQLTSTVKSSLFIHVHSSPLSLAARLHRCHTNSSLYINNGWSLSGQTVYTVVKDQTSTHVGIKDILASKYLIFF